MTTAKPISASTSCLDGEVHKLVAYDFATTPSRPEEYEEHAYWRDVGTIDAYYRPTSTRSARKPEVPHDQPPLPIYASPDQAESAQIEDGVIHRSVVGSGSIVDGAELDHAMLRRSVLVERGACIEHSIVMERSRIGQGARVRRAIVDQDNDIPPGERIGFDLEQDRKRFPMTPSGIVVVPAGTFPARQSASPFLAAMDQALRMGETAPRLEVLA